MVQKVLKEAEKALKEGEYRELVMRPTETEEKVREAILASKDSEKLFKKWEYDFYWRRLINADYYRHLKTTIMKNEFL